jgi:hypothetical protein
MNGSHRMNYQIVFNTIILYFCIMKNEFYKMDKTAFSVSTMEDESDEKAYWLSKTPEERISALEYMRQMLYGYDPATERLQRVLTVIEPEQG